MGDHCEDFEEEEVWAVMRPTREKERSPKVRRAREPTGSPAPQRLPIPISAAHAESNGPAPAGSGRGGRTFRLSGPVNVPDWSKIYGKSVSPEGNSYRGATGSGYSDGDGEGTSARYVSDEEDDEDGMLPPHEWIARKLARNQISSFSVCEGAGRTLKGRDLSRVRNVVLSRTGFLE